MRAVRSKPAGAELLVLSAPHQLGLRFRLRDPTLSGRADLVFTRWNIVVFVNGCVWHRHPNCTKATTPNLNVDFGVRKFEVSRVRDERNSANLIEMGWRVAVIRKCEASTRDKAERSVAAQFSKPLAETTKPPRKPDTRSKRI